MRKLVAIMIVVSVGVSCGSKDNEVPPSQPLFDVNGPAVFRLDGDEQIIGLPDGDGGTMYLHVDKSWRCERGSNGKCRPCKFPDDCCRRHCPCDAMKPGCDPSCRTPFPKGRDKKDDLLRDLPGLDDVLKHKPAPDHEPAPAGSNK